VVVVVVVGGGGGGGVVVGAPEPLPPLGVGVVVGSFPPLEGWCPVRLTGLVAGWPALGVEPPPAATGAVGAGVGAGAILDGTTRWCARLVVGDEGTMTFSVGAELAGGGPEPDRVGGRRTVPPESRIRAIAAPPRMSAASGAPATRAIARNPRPFPCSSADTGPFPLPRLALPRPAPEIQEFRSDSNPGPEPRFAVSVESFPIA
jgi:hypothetical protein